MNWLLITVLVIIGVNALIGMRVGFVKTIFSLCSMILALMLTSWLSPMVNDIMRSNEKFYTNIQEKVEIILPFEEKDAKASEQVAIIEGLPVPQSIKDTLIANNNSEVYTALSVNSFKDYVAGYLTGIVINAMAFSGTFLVLIVALWALCFALDIISKLPLLKQVNKTAGLIAGVIHGLIVVWIGFIVLTIFQSTELGQEAMRLIEEDQVLSIIYDNNVILSLITSATKIFL